LEVKLAIVVDKEQKKKDIALSCKALILEFGINNITVSQIAKAASVGKGTIYEYFKNKEDIVFELIDVLMQEHNEQKRIELEKSTSTREKVKKFFDFFYNEQDYELREIYKEFIAISIMNPSEELLTFQTECYEFYAQWMKDILSSQPDDLILGLFASVKGMYMMSVTTNAVTNLEEKINSHIDILFDLMEKK